MATRLSLVAHLSSAELFERYRHAPDPVERSRFQALWMLSCGHSSREVIGALGYRDNWLYRVVARYNAEGPRAMADGRHRNRGHAPLLSPDQLTELADLLEALTPEGEPWSGPRVARWMSETLGRPVAPQRGWDYLKKAGCTPQQPRPRHQEADAEAQARFPAGAAARA